MSSCQRMTNTGYIATGWDGYSAISFSSRDQCSIQVGANYVTAVCLKQLHGDLA
ncbi:hypothetical protein D3C80_2185200 [compost metagenome]